MPRPKRASSVGGEENLARRISFERERLGWSYETLAQKMTAAGAPIAASALHRIEKGEPRRRVTVDELLALSEVFGVPVADLLTRMELLRKERGREVIQSIETAEERLLEVTEEYIAAWVELWELAAADPELHEYVMNHLAGEEPAGDDTPSLLEVDVPGGSVDTSKFNEAFGALLVAAWHTAADAVEASLENGEA